MTLVRMRLKGTGEFKCESSRLVLEHDLLVLKYINLNNYLSEAICTSVFPYLVSHIHIQPKRHNQENLHLQEHNHVYPPL